MSTPGYTRLTATELGTGAQEVWNTAIADQESEPCQAGNVIQTFDHTMYLAFDTEARSRPYVLVLGTETVRQGPLIVSTDAGPAFSFSDLAEPGDNCRIRPLAGSGRGYVLSVGSVLEIEIDSGIVEVSSESPSRIRALRSIERDGDVWRRCHDVLEQVRAENDDGLGWLDALVRAMDEDECFNESFQQITETLVELLEQRSSENVDTTPLVQLVGLGPGSTPSGDDILSGILFTLMRTTEGQDRQAVQNIAENILRQSESATTTMSLALLEQAAQGRAPAAVENCLTALLEPQPSSKCRKAVSEMVEMGHHSGPDALAGMLTVLLVVAPSIGRKKLQAYES